MSESLTRALFGDAGFTIERGRYRHAGGLTCQASDPAWFRFGGTPPHGVTAGAPWAAAFGHWRADLPATYLAAAGEEGWPAILAWLQSSLGAAEADMSSWAPPPDAELDAWLPATERTLRAGSCVRPIEVLAGPGLLSLRVQLAALPAAGSARAIELACLQDWQARSRMVRFAAPESAPSHFEVALAGAPAPLEPLVQTAASALRAAAAILPALEVLSASAELADPTFINDVAAWWRDGSERNNKNRRRK